MKRKRSLIWKLPENEFIELVKNSKTLKNVLGVFGLKNKGGNNRTAWERIKHLNLNTDHFLNRIESSHESRKITLDVFKKNYLIENSLKDRSTVKKYLIKFNLLEWRCNSCGNNGIWNGKTLSLQLEHKNGVSNDNRLKNLCFLCPNCHSQTDTFAGKKLKRKNTIVKRSYRKKNKINWPSNEILKELILEYPLIHLGGILGVSDNAIRKHCYKNNIKLPKNGYWQKIHDNLGKWRKSSAIAFHQKI